MDIESNWGWDEENLRAYSEVTVHYLVRDPGQVRAEDSYTARSECGMRMSDGTGSTAPAGISANALAVPRALRLGGPADRENIAPEDRPTSAPGTPQRTGFTAEDSLTTDDGADYHLLSTRELELPDRGAVTDVLAATRETGDVEGETASTRWSLYSAEAAGEQVPVLEIELADGAIVQVRPDLPGVQPPEPDVSEVTTEPSPVPSESPSPPPGEPEPTPEAETTTRAPTTPTTTTTEAAADE